MGPTPCCCLILLQAQQLGRTTTLRETANLTRESYPRAPAVWTAHTQPTLAKHTDDQLSYRHYFRLQYVDVTRKGKNNQKKKNKFATTRVLFKSFFHIKNTLSTRGRGIHSKTKQNSNRPKKGDNKYSKIWCWSRVQNIVIIVFLVFSFCNNNIKKKKHKNKIKTRILVKKEGNDKKEC